MTYTTRDGMKFHRPHPGDQTPAFLSCPRADVLTRAEKAERAQAVISATGKRKVGAGITFAASDQRVDMKMLRKMLDAGKTRRECAAHFQVSYQAIWLLLRK